MLWVVYDASVLVEESGPGFPKGNSVLGLVGTALLRIPFEADVAITTE
jgi:hypothetical protein